MYPPLQLPASFAPEVPQDMRTCSERLRSTPGVFSARRTDDSRARRRGEGPATAAAPLISHGCDEVPAVVSPVETRRGAHDGGLRHDHHLGADTGREVLTSPKRALLSSGLNRVMDVSPACHWACFAAMAALTCETSSAWDNGNGEGQEGCEEERKPIRVFLMGHVL